MLDGMSVDQLRTFIAAADEGSFSAAGRRLRRAQSVVSATLANLEAQVGFPLFDRSGRYPKLTEAGVAMLEAARLAAAGMDAFKAKARTLAEGLEPELAVSVDVMFPVARLTAAVQAFHQAFPDTPLRLYVEALGAVLQPLLDGHCRVAITGSLPHLPAGCTAEFLLSVPAVAVVSRGTRWLTRLARSCARFYRSTSSLCWPIAPLSPRAGALASCRQGHGIWRIWARSTPSCAPGLAGAICRCRWLRRISRRENWSR